MHRLRLFAALVALIALAACSLPGPEVGPDGVHDPYEAANRKVHAFNTGLDSAVVRAAGTGYSDGAPGDLRRGLSNLSANLSLPRTVVNQLLQARLLRAGRNTLRFTANTVLGFGGLADVASDMGLPPDTTDFGETLHVWGLPEGAYLELPLIGPSTERDAVGEVVDFALNPLDPLLSRGERRAKFALRVLDQVGDRGESAGVIDEVLYDSADSYSQLRIIYLQNRRFELGGGAEPAAEPDPFALDTEGF